MPSLRYARHYCRALILMGLCTIYSHTTWADNHPVSAFESYLDGLAAAQFNDHTLAGMTVVVIKDGQVLLNKGYGWADLASLTAVDPDRHMFRPGSVSKLFTWTAVMQLVEQGKLDLNADVGQYIDQFELPNAYDDPLTLTHIMTHTPGLEDRFTGLFGDEVSDILPLAESLESGMPAQVRPPGVQAAYSNWATALAGLVVANVSGMSFEDYVSQHIFKPLGMQASTFDEPLPPALAGNMATGYVMDEGELAVFPFEIIKNFGPAGALSATSTDLANFMLAHLQAGQFNGHSLLRPDTVALMHSQLFSHHAKVDAFAHGFYESSRHGRRFIGHGGDTIAFHSQLTLQPDDQFGLFVSFNAAEGAQARAAIVNGILDYFYPAPDPQFVFEPIEGNAERIAEVVGGYRLNRRSFTTFEAIVGMVQEIPVTPTKTPGAINIPAPNLGGKFYEIAPYEFQKVGSDARLVFTKNEAGVVSNLLISSVPMMVGEKVTPFTASSTQILMLVLTLLASLFVIINYIRNRKDGLSDRWASNGRLALVLAGVSYLLFALGLGAIAGAVDVNRVVFNFPPSGTGVVLIFPVVGAVFTLLATVCWWPVLRAPECGIWARIRYTYVLIIFILFLFVLNYWNMLGWKY